MLFESLKKDRGRNIKIIRKSFLFIQRFKVEGKNIEITVDSTV
jgi:hypothetical protein